MVRRYYITGGNNPGDPAVGALAIVDPYFQGKEVAGFSLDGVRDYSPSTEWEVDPLTLDTISVLTGEPFKLNEVWKVEVGSTTDAELPGVDPYLPDIIKLVIARVNAVFAYRAVDPFQVYYDHGLYEQVGTDRLRSGRGYLLVWLVMPFTETAPIDDSYYGDANCKILIATATSNNYTQLEREDINFHPRLIPVYREIINQLKLEPKLLNGSKVDHTKRVIPYWGGGEPAGPGQANLWKDNVEGIEIANCKLKIGHAIDCIFTSNF